MGLRGIEPRRARCKQVYPFSSTLCNKTYDSQTLVHLSLYGLTRDRTAESSDRKSVV